MRRLTPCTLSALMLLSGAAAMPADLKRGQDLFRVKCASCHSFGCNRLGPKLAGLEGRKAGAVADFRNYSDAMRGADLTWNTDTLSAFLQDSSKLVPGNSMAGAAPPMPDARERRDLVAFMQSGDRRLDLC